MNTIVITFHKLLDFEIQYNQDPSFDCSKIVRQMIHPYL